MANGVIKRLVTDKGFGFIADQGAEYFFHRSSVKNAEFESLREGDRVSFEPRDGAKGPRAEDVRVAA